MRALGKFLAGGFLVFIAVSLFCSFAGAGEVGDEYVGEEYIVIETGSATFGFADPDQSIIYATYFEEAPKSGLITLISLINNDPLQTNQVTLDYTDWEDQTRTVSQKISLAPHESVLFSPSSTTEREFGNQIPEDIAIQKGHLKVTAGVGVVTSITMSFVKNNAQVSHSTVPLVSDTPMNLDNQFSLYLPFYHDTFVEDLEHLGEGTQTLMSLVSTDPFQDSVVLVRYTSWEDPAEKVTSRIVLGPLEGALFSPPASIAHGRVEIVSESRVVGSAVTSEWSEGELRGISQIPLSQSVSITGEDSTRYLPVYRDNYLVDSSGNQQGTLTLISLVNTQGLESDPTLSGKVTLECSDGEKTEGVRTQEFVLLPQEAVLFSPASTSRHESGREIPNVLTTEGWLKVQLGEGIIASVVRTEWKDDEQIAISQTPLVGEVPQDPEGKYSLYLPLYEESVTEFFTLIGIVNSDSVLSNTVSFQYSHWDPELKGTQREVILAPQEVFLFSMSYDEWVRNGSLSEPGAEASLLPRSVGRVKIAAQGEITGIAAHYWVKDGEVQSVSYSQLALESTDLLGGFRSGAFREGEGISFGDMPRASQKASETALLSETSGDITNLLDQARANADGQFDFGTLMGTPTTHRFKTDATLFEIGVISAPWLVRTFTDNDTNFGVAARAGMVGVDGENAHIIPLKVWCPNFGGGQSAPDPNDDAFWLTNVGWLTMFEDNQHKTVPDAENPFPSFTWRALAWTWDRNLDGVVQNVPGFTEVAPLGPQFPVNWAIDLFGAVDQAYGTVVYLELLTDNNPP